MSKPRKPKPAGPPTPFYRGANVPMRVIRRYVRQVAERFHPERIILFGSYAYGTPNEESDVDLLVVMPAYSELSKAAQILIALEPPFSADLIVRTPKDMAWRTEEQESFTTEIVTKGKALYEAGDAGAGPEGGSRPPVRRKPRPRK